MKKFLLIAILSSLILVSCSNKYNADRSYLTNQQIEMEKDALSENLEKYNHADDSEKVQYAFEIGFRYANLGKYDKSIEYYEEFLKSYPDDFVTLNNLAVIYEEIGEIQKALEYEKMLYQTNPTNGEVVNDVIRLLVKNQQFDDAKGVVETFAKFDIENGNKNSEFISSQFEHIKKSEEDSKKQI